MVHHYSSYCQLNFSSKSHDFHSAPTWSTHLTHRQRTPFTRPRFQTAKMTVTYPGKLRKTCRYISDYLTVFYIFWVCTVSHPRLRLTAFPCRWSVRVDGRGCPQQSIVAYKHFFLHTKVQVPNKKISMPSRWLHLF